VLSRPTTPTRPTAPTRPAAPPRPARPDAGLPANALGGEKGAVEQIALYVFVIVPFLALLAVVPAVWGWGLSWTDVVLFAVFYVVSGLGITVGYHRHFTHGSFKASRWLRVALTVAGTRALEGEPTRWVADHRRHHAFSDRDGDPHSPWRYGESVRGVAKGLLYAHCGWFFDGGLTNRQRFAPDLLADRDIRRIDRMVVPLSVASLLAPAVAGGLLTWSWQGALTAFFCGGLVRMALAHHVTCSINSVCHVVGDRPFQTRKGDRAANFWPLALLSFGESWHNSHHADPTCARHGVLRGQIDPAARLIWLFERLGWVHAVRWPDAARLAGRRMPAPATGHDPSRSA